MKNAKKQSKDEKENDRRKVYSSAVLVSGNPVSPQPKCYVDVVLHFCSRGRGYVKFYEKMDSDSRRNQCHFLINELKHTITVWERELHCSTPDLWARQGESSGYKTIRDKLHAVCQAFFQKSNMSFKKTGVWYLRCSVGKNNIVNFIRVISEKAGLSSNYTNHFLRVLHSDGTDDTYV